MLFCVLRSQVRATSHKPDEIYGIIERLSPGTRKIELFGRPHNVQPNWLVDFCRFMKNFTWRIHNQNAPCGLRGCKNRAHSISWPEIVKGVPNQDVDYSVS